jgi:methylase of polypeptide subunit release factors
VNINLPGSTREARFLLAGFFLFHLLTFYLYWDQDLSVEKTEQLNTMVEERLREFLYNTLLKEWEFFSLHFCMEKGVYFTEVGY